jgi:hypothetical protein
MGNPQNLQPLHALDASGHLASNPRSSWWSITKRAASAGWGYVEWAAGGVGYGAEYVVDNSGVWVLGKVDWVAPSVVGHHYETSIPLGKFPGVTPKMLLDYVRYHPKSFPIPGDKNFDLGATVTLTYAATPNRVQVEKIDESDPNRASMLLKAEEGHFFRGTAEHIIISKGDQLTYLVIGNGPDKELWDRNKANLLFGKYMWPQLVRDSVIPAAQKLEAGLKK